MPDNAAFERLQPSLLDRLTDLEPGERTETRAARVIDLPRLREIVQRDLAWLLNTQNSEDRLDAVRYPRSAASVLNFGIRPTSGDHSTERKAEEVRRSILRAIAAYEPRLVKGSVTVDLRREETLGEMHVAFDIRADLWAHPTPMELYLRSRIDLTTGEIEMERV